MLLGKGFAELKALNLIKSDDETVLLLCKRIHSSAVIQN